MPCAKSNTLEHAPTIIDIDIIVLSFVLSFSLESHSRELNILCASYVSV